VGDDTQRHRDCEEVKSQLTLRKAGEDMLFEMDGENVAIDVGEICPRS